MTAEIFIGALLAVAILAFVSGEAYGRAAERRVRERMRDRARVRNIEAIRNDIRELAWNGPRREEP